MQALAIKLATNLDEVLQYSYSLALFSWLSGILVFFIFLRFLNFSYLISTFATLALFFSHYSTHYSLLIMYDALSILLSTAMLFALYQNSKNACRKNLYCLYFVSIISMLTSWYVVFIIFTYGIFNIVKHFKKNDLFSSY